MDKIKIFLATIIIITFIIFCNIVVAKDYTSDISIMREISDSLSSSDIFQSADERYLGDSTKYKEPPTIEVGQKIYISDEIITKNGKELQDFKIKFEGQKNYTFEEFLSKAHEKYGDMVYDVYLNSKKNNLHPFLVEEGNGRIAYAEIKTDANGTYFVVNEDILSACGDVIRFAGFSYIDENGKLREKEAKGYFRVYAGIDGEAEPWPDPEEDGYRYWNVEVTTNNYTHLTPSVSASISNDKYDVTKAIPTSENLTYSITADRALYDIATRTYKLTAGVKDITITLKASYTYTYTTDEPEYKLNEKGEIEKDKDGKYIVEKWKKVEKTGTSTVSRTLDGKYDREITKYFYDVPKSNIYPVFSGVVSARKSDDTLNSGGLSLSGTATPGAQIFSAIKGKKPDVGDKTGKYYYSLGTYSSKREAEKAIESVGETLAKQKIDTIIGNAIGVVGAINYGYEGLNVTTESISGTPNVGKASNLTTKVIPSNYSNGTYDGTAVAFYANGSFPTGCNNVLIHTPVVNKTKITVEKFVNQKINKDTKVTYLQLDKQFIIRIPDDGQHISEKGYGNRKYNTNGNLTITPKETSWGKEKTIMIPFDVYRHNSDGTTTFIPAREVQKVKGNTDYTYTIPSWVWEDKYTIETRVIAENKQNDNAEVGANLNSNNYIAKQDILVEIVGKIYDLRVSSSNDPGWYNNIKGEYITDKDFPFGQQSQNKVPSYKYAPKLGYTFVFDFKTKGRKSNNIDVRAYTEFYFVSKNGGSAKKVDLYYNTVNEKCVKINEQDARVPLIVKYNDTYMKVPSQEKIDTNKIYKTKYNYNLGVNVGTFASMHLPHDLRLCYNNFDEYVGKLYGKNATKNSIISDATKVTYADETNGGENIVIGSVGHWFAGYRLPASTVAVDTGTKVTPSNVNSVKKVDGYILVKMNIKTNYQNWPYLKYTGPEGLNENANIPTPDWEKTYDPSNPSNHQDITLPNGNPADVPNGTIIIYDSDLRSTNDAETSGTH